MLEGKNMFSRSARETTEGVSQMPEKPADKPSFSKSENAERLEKKKAALTLAASLRGLNNGFDPQSFSDEEISKIYLSISMEDIDLFLSKGESELNGLGSKKGETAPSFIEEDPEVVRLKEIYNTIVGNALAIRG
jgi:hypothetical protein